MHPIVLHVSELLRELQWRNGLVRGTYKNFSSPSTDPFLGGENAVGFLLPWVGGGDPGLFCLHTVPLWANSEADFPWSLPWLRAPLITLLALTWQLKVKNTPSSQMVPILLTRPWPLLGPTLFPAILGLSCCLSACPVMASSLPRGGLDPSRPRPRSP